MWPRWRGNEEQRFYKVPISTRALNPRPHSLFPLRTHDYAGALSAYVRREYVWPRRASVSTSSSSSSSSSFCSECALPPSARSFPLFLTSEMPVVRWVRGGRGWPGKEPLVMIRPLTLTPWLGREPVASQPQMESFDTREEPALPTLSSTYLPATVEARSYDLPVLFGVRWFAELNPRLFVQCGGGWPSGKNTSPSNTNLFVRVAISSR